MHKEKVLAYLQGYRSNRKQLLRLDRELAHLEKLLVEELCKNKYILPGSPPMVGMPRGNLPSSPVERWWEELEKRGGLTARSERILKEMRWLRLARRVYTRQVRMVREWLSQCNEEEKFVIRHSYLYPKNLQEICRKFCIRFDTIINSETLRKKRYRALMKLCELA